MLEYCVPNSAEEPVISAFMIPLCGPGTTVGRGALQWNAAYELLEGMLTTLSRPSWT